MSKKHKKALSLPALILLLVLALIFGIPADDEAPDAVNPAETIAVTEETSAADSTEAPTEDTILPDCGEEPTLDPEGSYTNKEDVALYIHLYDRLPNNFITKEEARALGWEGGGLEPYSPGMCIGGDRFGNYEGLLPSAPGRQYYECDIDTLGADSRGAKRIVFSNDGLVYYTHDHYKSFELLYGEP